MKESKREISFLRLVATKDNFEQMIRKEPKVLHISCHGIKIEARHQPMQLNCDGSRKEYHYLLFENSYGAGELVSGEQLQNFMQSTKHQIDVVFVAACDSEYIGKIFQRCGAKHVVCVE